MMQVQPIMPGLVALEATGSSYTIGLLVDTLDALPGWEIASEITTASNEHSETIMALLMRQYDPTA